MLLLLSATIFTACFKIKNKTDEYSFWPEKPITIVCGQGAGGGTDQTVRALAVGMEKKLGVAINVINQPGASGSIAMDFVSMKPSDGYWIQANSGFNKPARVMGHSDLIPWKDWYYVRFVSAVASYSVLTDSPIKDIYDLIEKAKKSPNTITISNSGVGSIWHEGNSIFADAAGIKLKNIPYTSGAEATLACLQKEVDVCGGGVHEHSQFLEAGKLRNLGIFSSVPITLNNGLVLEPVKKYIPSMEKDGTFGPEMFIAVKRDTPPAIIKKIEEAARYARETEEFIKLCKDNWFVPEIITGEEADRKGAYSESLTAWLFYDIKLEGVKKNPADLNIPRPADFDKWWPPKEYSPVVFD